MNYHLETIRSKFPALSIEDSGRKRIYFDNPAGTQVPIEVADAMKKCMIESNANIQGGFETSNRVDKILDAFHQSMADDHSQHKNINISTIVKQIMQTEKV